MTTTRAPHTASVMYIASLIDELCVICVTLSTYIYIHVNGNDQLY